MAKELITLVTIEADEVGEVVALDDPRAVR